MTVVHLDEHGTRAAYRRCTAGEDGSACRSCRAANAAATAESRRSPRTYVPVGSVRKHIAELQDCGLSLREIGRLADVDRETVRGIVAGDYPRCTVETKRRVLGVLPPRQGSYKDVVPDEGDEAEEPRVDVLASLRLLLADPDELAWKADADCTSARTQLPVQRVQEWFFPDRGASAKPALGICAHCPVWEPCLAFAIEHNHDGIWGRSAGSHRRQLVQHDIAVEELALVGMRDDPELSIADAIGRVLAAREAVA